VSAPAEEADRSKADWRTVARLFRFVLPHRWIVAASIGIFLVASLLALARPWAITRAIDRGIVPRDPEGLAFWLLIFGLLSLFDALIEYLRTRVTILTGQKVIFDVRRRLFGHIHTLPLRFFDRTPVGALVTRVSSDVEALAEMFSSGVAAVCHDLLSLAVVAAWLFVIDVKLALVSLALLPVLLAFSLWFGKRMRLAFRAIRACVSRLNGFQQEAFTGVRVTRLFRREEAMQGRFDERNVALRDGNFDAVFNFALFGPVVETASELARAGLLVLGSSRIAGAGLTWGEFTFFWVALGLFFKPLRELSDRFNVLQAALAAAERIFAVLDEPPEPPDPPGAAAPARLEGSVRFENVGFAYKEGEPVLRGLSFSVEPGQTVAIVGPTGAGKTSIISLLSRLWEPQSGRILVDGIPLDRYARRALRSRIAVVLQDVFLFSGTVGENIRLGNPALGDADVRAAAQAVHAAPFLEGLPGGYGAEIRERGGNLSVGQKQLLAFARALAADPDILVLDEATSSIDAQTERLIQQAEGTLLHGRTAIVIAHRLSTVRRADRILCLHRGQLVEEGTHDELLARGGLYARLHRLSYEGSSDPGVPPNMDA